MAQHLTDLSWSERYVAAETWLTMLWVSALLRTHWHKRLFMTSSPIGEPRLSQLQVQRMAQLVNGVANHHIKPMKCLERAVTSQFLLSRRGCRADLRFGVRKGDTTIEAHAWLEGLPGLNDPLSPCFTPLKKYGE
jgi:hypothetical protein